MTLVASKSNQRAASEVGQSAVLNAHTAERHRLAELIGRFIADPLLKQQTPVHLDVDDATNAAH